MNQPIFVPQGPPMFGPQGPPGFVPQSFFNTPNKKTAGIGISGLIIICIICIIIWLIFLKKDGSFSVWSEWDNCDNQCGGGKQRRTRIYTPAAWGGVDLPNKDEIIEEQECNTDLCPIDGYMTSWTNIGICSTPCRGEKGTQTQKRSFIPPKHGGTTPNDYTILSQDIECDLESCKSASASVTTWENIVDNSNQLIYKDNNNNNIDIKSIDPVLYLTDPNFKVYSEKKRTFYKEGLYYIGLITLDKLLTDEKNKNEISDNEINLIKSNGGGDQIKKIEKKDGFEFRNELISTLPLSECNPIQGKDRWKTKTSIYYFPTGNNPHHTDFQSIIFWDDINNLSKDQSTTWQDNPDDPKIKIKFTRKNGTIPKQYTVEFREKCEPIRYHQIDTLKNLWTDGQIAGCKTDILDSYITPFTQQKTIDDYSYLQNGKTDLATIIKDNWGKSKLLNTNDTKLINQCYGNDGYFVVKSNRSNTKLYPGTEINNENGTKDIEVLVNGNFKLIFQTDGNLVLYNGTPESKNAIWSTKTDIGRTDGKLGTKLRMQHDGNLVIYTNNDTSLWASNTNNMDKNITSAELTDKGFLVINNQNNNILKIFPDFNIIKEHLIRTHWEKSPWALFADKAGNVWKANWSDINKNLDGQPNVDNFPVEKNNEECSASPKYDYCPFKGLRKPISDSEWDVNALDLKDMDGYNKELSPVIKPAANSNNTTRNYNTYGDLKNFENDKYSPRKPPQLTGGIEKPNYIPGYKRISSTWGKTNNDNTRWFLVSKRGGSDKDQAFVLFYIIKDKNDYADDIINNHPDLINKLLNDPSLKKLIQKYIGSNKDWAIPYRNELLNKYKNSLFSNKSIFNNKYINNVDSFINYRMNQKNKSNFSNKLNNAYLETIMY